MMPNHITNILKAPKNVIKAMISDSKVDFNNIVKTPEILEDFEPHSGIENRAKLAMGLFSIGDGFLEKIELSNAVRNEATQQVDS